MGVVIVTIAGVVMVASLRQRRRRAAAATRARIDPIELKAELGFVTVPPVLVDTAEQSSSS